MLYVSFYYFWIHNSTPHLAYVLRTLCEQNHNVPTTLMNANVLPVNFFLLTYMIQNYVLRFDVLAYYILCDANNIIHSFTLVGVFKSCHVQRVTRVVVQ